MKEGNSTDLFILNKLVRDKRYEEMQELGRFLHEKCLANHKVELIRALHDKATEEIKEIHEECRTADNSENVAKELADLQQVIHDLQAVKEKSAFILPYEKTIEQLCTQYSIDIQQVLDLTKQSFEKDGGFLGGHYVKWLRIKPADKWHAYFVKKYGITSNL